jgi:hypothetical protein
MQNDRAVRLADLVHHLGADLSVPDPEKRRLGRLERVQAAWLRDLSAGRPAADDAAPPETAR